MKNKLKTIGLSFFIVTFLGNSIVGNAQTNADYSAVPPSAGDFDPPQIMLTLSRDHQYFFKAYNDYTDLDPDNPADVDADGNPIIETTYKHSFDYFGYFDLTKCYTYSTGDGRFNPVSISGDKYCSGAEWSGNFLNWASMTRMDIVRSIFYGGSRSTDTATETVLERSFLPSDAHSFAKYYNGDDLARLTPYNTTRTDTTNGGDSDGFDDIDEGITFCNTTYDTGGSSQASTALPVIRAAEGNHQLWGANERWQCTWDDERGDNTNANIPPSAPLEVTVGTNTFDLDSGIDASTSDPEEGDEYTARVQVCANDALIGSERCKLYPDGNLKPIGILQTYGDAGSIQFGLMTGSYNNNIEGGVLRKNVSPFSDEVDVLGDGTFTFTATSESIVRTIESLRPWGYNYGDGTYRGGGQFDDCTFQLTTIPNGQCRSWGNPISEIYKETVRYIAGLNPSPDFITDDSTLITGLRTATWDNPLDETNQCAGLNTIVINASVSSYDDDSTDIDGVSGGINGSDVNATALTTDEWTDRVGASEGIYGDPVVDTDGNVTFNGEEFLIGRSGADNNEFCDSKTITDLSETFGLCPEAPTVSGSFAMAGIAYYAHNNDIRDDLEGNQTLNTFAISLATNTPTIVVPRTNGGTPVTILPAYRLITAGEDGGGALVDFKIVQPHTRIGNTNTFSARYYVTWEDSEQGGDYDQDMWGLIDYVLDEDSNELTITTTAVGQSTGGGQLFGFVTNGTTQDGFHAYSGILGANFTDPTGVPGCNNCRELVNSFNGNRSVGGQEGPQSHTFTISSENAAGILESPLYYAAKYGGFTEADELTGQAALNAVPNEVSEWDEVNNTTGAEVPDGLPDNYFFVINPQQLFDSLNRSLAQILSQTTSSGTAVANFAAADGFANLVTQAFFQASITDQFNNEAAWAGQIISYFIDDFGNFREDTNGNKMLDRYCEDRVFAFDFDDGSTDDNTADDIVQIIYPTPTYGPTTANGGCTVELDDDGEPELSRDDVTNELIGDIGSIDDLRTVWDARSSLTLLDNDDIREQRGYSDIVPVGSEGVKPSGASRYIFTFIDDDLDGEVDSGEQRDFISTEIDNDNFGFFGVGSTADAQAVVDYIRGYEDPVTPLRNRTLDLGGVGNTFNSNDSTFRLGDIVNSTPEIVGPPTQAYDVVFGDPSYEPFRRHYQNRRQMVYVGANDGLLHAFNAGFRTEFERDTNDFSVAYETNLDFLGDLNQSPPTVTAHPLGAEIWAYAPYNLLPHLQWLTSGFYTHVFYVDGAPEVYEAKIFEDASSSCNVNEGDAVPATCTHPNGWGTILVVGMRLGGGDFPITLSNGDSTTTRSAYVVLDITDPEQPPTLIAEITHPDMNLTSSSPTLYYDCDGNCNNDDQSDNFDGEWTLVFGSGPNSIQTFDTNESAKIFTYELETQILEVHEVTDGTGNAVEDSFVGGLQTRDWDNGETGSRDDDVIYFGTTGTRTEGVDEVLTGGVYRFRPKDNDSTSLLFDANRPVSTRPLTLANEDLSILDDGEQQGDFERENFVLGSWVYFGTGVYNVLEDENTNGQERYYGIREPVDLSTLLSLPDAVFDENNLTLNSDLLTYATVVESDLLDTTAVGIINNDNGTLGPNVATGDLSAPIAGATNFNELRQYILRNTLGWFRDLPTAALPTDPSARSFTDAAFLSTQLFFTTFMPDSNELENVCVAELGESELFALNLTTGTASPFAGLGIINNDLDGIADDSVSLDDGTAGSPLVFSSDTLGGNKIKIITQKDNLETDNRRVTTGNSKVLRSGWRQIIE